MRRLTSARWRHEHRRALRLLVAVSASLTLLAGAGGVAVAATSGGGGGSPFGDEQVGGTYANGILLPTQQWIKPVGTRVLTDDAAACCPRPSAPTASSWRH